MKDEMVKMWMVMAVGITALVALSTFFFHPASFTSLDLSGQAIQMNYQSESVEEAAPATSEGCCNWDCDHNVWECRERSIHCSVGKPVVICRD